MTRDETARELERLRAEVATLSKAREETTGEPVSAAPASPDTPVVGASSSSADDAEDAEISQFEELGALLEAEIRDLPTVTCLVVFSLGVLMGRLMR